ncbi:MAG: hypothetical protein ACLU9L_01465 [Christensenellales bacterium]
MNSARPIPGVLWCALAAKPWPEKPAAARQPSKIWDEQRPAHPRGTVVRPCRKAMAGKASGGCANPAKYGMNSARPIPGVLWCALAAKPWPEKPAAAAPTQQNMG